MGSSHWARDGGAVILNCVLYSMEHAFNKCLWVSENGGQLSSLYGEGWF